MKRLLGSLGAVGMVLILAGCGSSGPAPLTTVARVDFVTGDVLIDGVVAQPGDLIRPIFQVNTGVASSVGIVFDEKNILEVAEETEAYIDLTADVKTVELRRGTVASALRKLAQVTARDQDRFRVKTSSAVAGVRGTLFFAKVEGAGSTYLCTCNGTLHLTDAAGLGAFTSEAAHHEAFRFVRDEEGRITVSPGEMAYHTDDDLEAQAARIGELIDWTRVEGRR